MTADPGAESAPDLTRAATPSMRTLLAAGAAAEAVCTPPRPPAVPDHSERSQQPSGRRTGDRRDAA